MIRSNPNIVFIHIPKCGGTFIEHHLTPGVDWHERGEKHLTLAETISHYGRERVEQCYRFAIVRNPYQRAVSAYLYYKRDAARPFVNQAWPARVKRALGMRERKSYMESFHSFFKAFLDSRFTKAEWLIRDMRPAAEFTRNHAGLKIDDIFYLEEIQTWLPFLRQKFLSDFNDIPVNAAPSYDYRQSLDKQTARAIEEFYSEDFELFYPTASKLSVCKELIR